MPSQSSPGGANQFKRPSIVSRNSSGQTPQSRSNSEVLSSSAQRHKASSRHVVGRMGPRVPSYTKNLSKLTKLTAGNGQPTSTSPQPHMNSHKRNHSTQALARNISSTALRKNHSETCLKKNRSSGQLAKLPRPHSSRNVRMHAKRDSKRNSQALAVETLENPTVRFDLGDEVDDQGESWVEESVSVSPNTTRSNTRANTTVHIVATEEAQNLPGSSVGEKHHVSQSAHREVLNTEATNQNGVSRGETSHRSDGDNRSVKSLSERDSITDKLLYRNVSFSTTAQVSSVSATAHDSVSSNRHGGQSSDQGELVSRFISAGSSSGTPRESSFLPPSDKADEETVDADQTNRSPTVKHGPQATRSRSTPKLSGSSGSISLPSSRTQQKLWLERASSSLEPQPGMPLGLMRTGRPGSLQLQSLGGDRRVNAQLKHLSDQTDAEYCRVRLFQRPLNEAIGRLRESGVLQHLPSPSNKITTRRGPSMQDQLYSVDQPVAASGPRAESTRVTEGKRSRVMFQGIRDEEHDGDEAYTTSQGSTGELQADYGVEARDLCRRLWERHTITGSS